MPDTSGLISEWQAHFDNVLAQRLEMAADAPGQLFEAMRYSVLSGGKRMRPLLVYGASRALGIEPDSADGIACAIEIIHAYSLIHDDLPAMDDDNLRRGQPTCHRAFDEATAILAGDALQALAFEILSRDHQLEQHPQRQVAIIRCISRACGAGGMAGGQVLDLSAVGRALSLEQLTTMHRLKTGALITASTTAPALLCHAPVGLEQGLARYGERVGLAFQIHDDVLDVTGSSELIGKSTRKDAAAHKPTFPSVIGLEESQAFAAKVRDEALQELGGFPGHTDCLEWLAHYAIDRES